MANIVEFLVKVKDLASGQLGKIATTGGKSFSQLEQGVSRFSAKLSRLDMSIGGIDKKLDQLRKTREISLDSRQVKRIGREMDALERQKAKLEGSGRSRGSGLSGLSGIAAGALALAGVAGVGGVIGAGMDKTMTNASFEVMAGKQQGKQLSGDLLKYAQDTIYGNEVLGIGKTMLGFGVQAKAVMPTVQRLGDIAMGDADKFKSLGLVFSQVAAQGRLMGNDVLQFINAGFNPLQVMSDKTGKSMAVLKQEMEDGKISFADVAGAIGTATGQGGRFYNMTSTLAESAPGKLLGLQGTFEGLTASVGVGMLEMMEPLMDFTQWLLDTPGGIQGLAAAIGTLTAGIAIWQIVTKWAAISQWFLNLAVMWPLIPILLLAAAIAALVMKYKGWGDATKALGTVLKSWFGNLGIYFKDFFQETGYKLDLFVLKIKNSFQFIGGMVGNLVKAIKLASEFKFGEAKQALTAEIKTKATAEIEALERKRNGQRTQNLADFKNNLDTIKSTSILGKLSLRKGKDGKSAADVGLMDGLGLGGAALGAGAGTPPASASGTNNGITGGGARNLTINVGKFFDDLHFHAASTGEGMQEIEGKFKEMFMRVVNSGNAAIAN